MRNLKRILALAIVFALSLTLFASANFADAEDIGENYVDDVNMLVELGVINGYEEDGVVSFKPQNNITRAEFAKMAYVLKYSVDDSGSLFASQRSQFTDVENKGADYWAKGYINYCANQGIVGGVGNNLFNPDGNVTVAEASKMLLVILGCDAEKEGFGGPNWISNVTAKAMALGVFDGWTGNPNEPATRELVAKLMRNTIFAPVYLYSPLTGIGSQVNILYPDQKNETLGEQTMGLKHVTGIVVANENYSIATDDEGDELEISTTIREDRSTVYYEYNTGNATAYAGLVIDRALSDDLLGNLVDVYFRADGTEGSYSNVKVIGNVLVNAKTRVYEVNAADIKIFPDGISRSSSEVRPYISFTVDGTTRRIEADSNADRVRPVDYDENETGGKPKQYEGTAFAGMSYVDMETTFSEIKKRPLALLADENLADSKIKFFENMGGDTLAPYRFVSVDGGSTYSYIFNFHGNERAFGYADVIQYNESTSTVALSQAIGTLGFDEVEFIGDIERGDKVVVFMKDGKYNIAKVEEISGAATAINADGSVVINGETYRMDTTIFNNNVSGYESLSRFYADNKGAASESTRYWVYNNFILDIDATAEVGAIEDYAVVLSSTYDRTMQAARVKLAFADGSEGTYEVSKFYTDRYDEYSDLSDRPGDFIHNQKVGWIYKFKIVNGRVDLSYEEGYEPTMGKSKVSGGKLVTSDDEGYTANAQSTLFLLYADYDNVDEKRQFPMRARVFKLNNVGDFSSREIKAIPYQTVVYDDEDDDEGTTYDTADMEFFNVVEDSRGYMKSVSVAAMTVGTEMPPMSVRDTDDMAYVVSMRQIYNIATDKYFVSAKLITVDGLIEVDSIDEPADAAGNTKWFNNDLYAGQEVQGFGRGTIIRFKMNSEGKLTTIDNENGTPEEMRARVPAEAASGLYYVTAMQLSNGVLAYFPYGGKLGSDGVPEGVALENGRLPAAGTLPLDNDYEIITIRDDSFAGNYLSAWSRNMPITATDYNAIVQFSSGKIIRIYSFEQF